ncbi:MAG: hypothetical protein ABFC77_14855 [Thermoguttaceae bacterium]
MQTCHLEGPLRSASSPYHGLPEANGSHAVASTEHQQACRWAAYKADSATGGGFDRLGRHDRKTPDSRKRRQWIARKRRRWIAPSAVSR